MCGGVEQKAHESHAAASRSVKAATEASKTARAAMSGPGEQPLVDREVEVTVGGPGEMMPRVPGCRRLNS